MKHLLLLAFTSMFFSLYTHAAEIQITAKDLPNEVLQGPRPQIESQKSKLILLDFWASWCGPCRESLPFYNQLQKKYAAQKVTFIAINVDEDKTDAMNFMKEVQIDFAVLRDQDRNLAKKLRIEAIPSLVVLDKDLKVISVERGYNTKKAKNLPDKIKNWLK